MKRGKVDLRAMKILFPQDLTFECFFSILICYVNLLGLKMRYTKHLRNTFRAKNKYSLPHLINDSPILRLNVQSSTMSFYFDPPILRFDEKPPPPILILHQESA